MDEMEVEGPPWGDSSVRERRALSGASGKTRRWRGQVSGTEWKARAQGVQQPLHASTLAGDMMYHTATLGGQ